jgi:hypothetical protein
MSKKVKIINLTGHEVKLRTPRGAERIIPSHGKLRARYTTREFGNLDTEYGEIPLTKNYYQRVKDIPEPEEGVYYLVSRLFAEIYPERDDFLITNGIIKEGTMIVACRSLAKI